MGGALPADAVHSDCSVLSGSWLGQIEDYSIDRQHDASGGSGGCGSVGVLRSGLHRAQFCEPNSCSQAHAWRLCTKNVRVCDGDWVLRQLV